MKKINNYDILDIYELFVIENNLIGRKNTRDIRNYIKQYAYTLFFKPVQKVTEKQIISCIKSTDFTGKRKESLRLVAYLNILLNFAKEKSIINKNPVSKILNKKLNYNKL